MTKKTTKKTTKKAAALDRVRAKKKRSKKKPVAKKKAKANSTARSKPPISVTDPALTISTKEATTLSQLTARRLNQLVDEGALPKPDRGRYPHTEFVQSLCRYYKSRAERGSQRLTEEARLKGIQADLRQMELSRMRRELVEWSAVELLISEVVIAMNSGLSALPARAALDLAGRKPAEIKAALNDEVAIVRNDIANGFRKLRERFGKMVGARDAVETQTAGPVGRRRKGSSAGTR